MNPQQQLLSQSEVKSALKKAAGPNATLKSFQTKSLGAGKVGYMGDHCTIEVEYQEARISYQATTNTSFFMKRIPDSKTFRDFITNFGLFAKEREMFEKLLPMMCRALRISKLSVPECYVICDNNYMIFEDLTRGGFKLENKYDYLSLEQCKSLIEALAQLHAGSIAIEAKTGKMMSYHMKNPHEVVIVKEKKAATNISAYWHTASQITTLNLLLKMECFRSRAQKVPVEILRQKLSQTWDKATEMAAGFSAKFANVLSHGDLWLNNMMFKQGPGGQWKAVLVDFQTYRYAPPVLDFLSFLHLTTSRKFRWNHQSELLKFYHTTLVKILEKAEINSDLAPPLDELEKSAFEMRLFGIAIAARYYNFINLV